MLESVFTQPRPECPHPERWHTDDGDSTEHEVTALVAGFVTALQPDLVIETGSAFGQTAEAIGRALAAAGHGRLVTLETDPERCDHTRDRCDGLPVEAVNASSLEWTPPGPVDFMWLDSLPNLRTRELARFAEHASPRCVVGIHDAETHAASIRSELRKLVDGGLVAEPLYLPTPRGVCFTRIKAR